jgi:upstream activation factor subunit UAF30
MAKAAKKAATTQTETPKTAAAKAPKKAAVKATGKAAAGKSAGGKATTNPGLAAPLTLSPELAKIVGKEPMPRTEIIKKMWDYIKAHDLQDKTNKRMINADDNLKVVFDGKDQVSMFELAKVINNHVKK